MKSMFRLSFLLCTLGVFCINQAKAQDATPNTTPATPAPHVVKPANALKPGFMPSGQSQPQPSTPVKPGAAPTVSNASTPASISVVPTPTITAPAAHPLILSPQERNQLLTARNAALAAHPEYAQALKDFRAKIVASKKPPTADQIKELHGIQEKINAAMVASDPGVATLLNKIKEARASTVNHQVTPATATIVHPTVPPAPAQVAPTTPVTQ